MDTEKYKLLKEGILYDVIGIFSMTIPVVGSFLDLLWAPFAAKKMRDMYKGAEGRVASVIVFVEELLPFTDIVPTFTLMWLYTFVWKKQRRLQPIKIKSNE